VPSEPKDDSAADDDRARALQQRDEELPVVARLIVEVRSDGTRTIARGGLEDATTGQRVTIDARGDTPAALAIALARSIFPLADTALPLLRRGTRAGSRIFRMPRLAARMSRGLLGRGRREK